MATSNVNRLYDPAGYDAERKLGAQAKAAGLPETELKGFHYSFYGQAWLDGYHGRDVVEEHRLKEAKTW